MCPIQPFPQSSPVIRQRLPANPRSTQSINALTDLIVQPSPLGDQLFAAFGIILELIRRGPLRPLGTLILLNPLIELQIGRKVARQVQRASQFELLDRRPLRITYLHARRAVHEHEDALGLRFRRRLRKTRLSEGDEEKKRNDE